MLDTDMVKRGQIILPVHPDRHTYIGGHRRSPSLVWYWWDEKYEWFVLIRATLEYVAEPVEEWRDKARNNTNAK